MTQLYLFENDYPYKRTKNPLVPSPKLEVSHVKLSYHSRVKPEDRPKVTCSQDAYNVFLNSWDMERIELVEEFKVLYLNRANQAIGLYEASVGGRAGTVVEPGHIAITGFLLNASGIILAHNHPSCNPKPSAQDIAMTKNMKEICKCAGMELLDHEIMPGNNPDYYSFADKGTMP